MHHINKSNNCSVNAPAVSVQRNGYVMGTYHASLPSPVFSDVGGLKPAVAGVFTPQQTCQRHRPGLWSTESQLLNICQHALGQVSYKTLIRHPGRGTGIAVTLPEAHQSLTVTPAPRGRCRWFSHREEETRAGPDVPRLKRLTAP